MRRLVCVPRGEGAKVEERDRGEGHVDGGGRLLRRVLGRARVWSRGRKVVDLVHKGETKLLGLPHARGHPRAEEEEDGAGAIGEVDPPDGELWRRRREVRAERGRRSGERRRGCLAACALRRGFCGWVGGGAPGLAHSQTPKTSVAPEPTRKRTEPRK